MEIDLGMHRPTPLLGNWICGGRGLFRKLGPMAIDAIGSSPPVRGVLEPQFLSGTTP